MSAALTIAGRYHMFRTTMSCHHEVVIANFRVPIFAKMGQGQSHVSSSKRQTFFMQALPKEYILAILLTAYVVLLM